MKKAWHMAGVGAVAARQGQGAPEAVQADRSHKALVPMRCGLHQHPAPLEQSLGPWASGAQSWTWAFQSPTGRGGLWASWTCPRSRSGWKRGAAWSCRTASTDAAGNCSLRTSAPSPPRRASTPVRWCLADDASSELGLREAEDASSARSATSPRKCASSPSGRCSFWRP